MSWLDQQRALEKKGPLKVKRPKVFRKLHPTRAKKHGARRERASVRNRRKRPGEFSSV